MKRHRRRRVLRIVSLVLVCLLAVYVGSYVVLSRRGMAMSEAAGFAGFYFFPPEDTDAWRRMNYGCVYVYYPLIMIDNWIGTGKGIGCEPMWRLSHTNDLPTACQLASAEHQSLIPNP
jgi:hypothetical protein